MALPGSQCPPVLRRVLLVEDNALAASSLCLFLESIGYEVYHATNGRSAIEMAREERPDVVLCDVGLPGEIDGLGVARAIRSEPDWQPALLLALTGYTGEGPVRKVNEAGFDRYLVKPIDINQLRRLIHEE